MEIYKAYKFRMYPNDNQKELIHKSFGTSRFIYNKILEYKDRMYKENVSNTYNCTKINRYPII